MPVIMKLEEPQVQQAQALALSCIHLGMRWGGWQGSSCSRSRSPSPPPLEDDAPQPEAASSAPNSPPRRQLSRRRTGRGQASFAARIWRTVRTASAAAGPLLPAAGLAAAAVAAVSVAASDATAPLRWLAGYAAAELGFQGFQCWRVFAGCPMAASDLTASKHPLTGGPSTPTPLSGLSGSDRYTLCNAHPSVPDAAGVPAVKERFFQLADVIDIRDFMSGWFHGVPFEAIRRGNVQEFIAYGFYCSTFERLTPGQQAATGDFVDRAERVWGVRFPPGTNPDIAPMRHLWEPLRVLPKPLAVHAVSEAAGLLTRVLLRRQGYRRSDSDGFAVWLRSPEAARSPDDARKGSRTECSAAGGGEDLTARPLVFLHGVGFGLFPYLHFVQMLAEAAPHHPVVLAEARHVSLRLCGDAPTVDDMTHAVACVLRRHGFRDACFVGHSYGTFVVSRMRQLYPEAVHSMALLDPVCLMTCSPHLLRNFIYTPARLDWRRPSLLGLMDGARWLCSRDLMIAAAFCRRFYWHELMLWPEHMPRGATVVALSTHDDLVPIRLVQAQLNAATDCDAHVMVHPTAGHGGFLVDLPFQERVVAEVQRLLVATGEKL